MKRLSIALAIFLFMAIKSKGQTQCDDALRQLTSYAQQFNALYAGDYNQIVYYNSCGYYAYHVFIH